MVKHMKQQGMSTTQVANELGRDRKTIRKWLQEEGPRNYERKREPSILEPYKAYVLSRLGEGCVNAVVFHDEIKAKGYGGQIRLLRAFMEPFRQRY